jgi:hypothetical protein
MALELLHVECYKRDEHGGITNATLYIANAPDIAMHY